MRKEVTTMETETEIAESEMEATAEIMRLFGQDMPQTARAERVRQIMRGHSLRIALGELAR